MPDDRYVPRLVARGRRTGGAQASDDGAARLHRATVVRFRSVRSARAQGRQASVRRSFHADQEGHRGGRIGSGPIPRRTGKDVRHLHGANEMKLTPCEQVVLSGVIAGQSNKEIAKTRGRGLGTVKYQMQTLMQKTGTRTRTELAVWALRNGIADVHLADRMTA